MRVLALCPYHAGSHERFLSDWCERSRHDFEVRKLPARHFKWRWRQAPVGLAEQARALESSGRAFDVIWTTALSNVAELRGLLPSRYRNLPVCTYFHENQFNYPSRSTQRDAANGWDVNLPLDNWVTGLVSEQIWFNSAYNRRAYFEGARALLSRMPDETSLDTLGEIETKSFVMSPGIDVDAFTPWAGARQADEPLVLGWASRWEHDKRPDLFLLALERVRSLGIAFKVLLLGQQFKSDAAPYIKLRELFADQLLHGGFVPDRREYAALLGRADVIVSTAEHEFFGLGILEGVAAGCLPCVPDRLVYPELYPDACRYAARSDDEAVSALAAKIAQLSQEKAEQGTLLARHSALGLPGLAERFSWSERARQLDAGLEDLLRQVP
ncbi:MAG TPA: DUF3524 domain-containing protein [Polyangiaceae bacterium]|nr:DUF3524 domain-containing protein [Polyangiaceae bacterium]